ncbi:MAG: protein kinase [Polyangiaceae bacterium]
MRTLAAAFPEWLPGVLRGFQELFDVLSVSSGFILFPVEVPDSEVARVLADWLSRRGVSVTTIEPKTDGDWEDLAASILRSAPPPEGGALMVIGGPQAASVRPAVIQALRLVNQRRDTMARHLKRPLLWTGPVSFLDATWNHAPDFWSVRALDQRIAPPEGGDALDSLRHLLTAAREQGDVRSEARLAVQLADDLSSAGAYVEAMELLGETLSRAKSEPVEVRGELTIRKARLFLLQGDTFAAEELMRALLEWPLPKEMVAAALLVLAGAHARAGRHEEALGAYEQALSAAEQAKDIAAEIQARIGIGLNSVSAGGPISEARASIQKAVEQAHAIGDPALEAHALRALSHVNAGLNDEADAKKLLLDALHREAAQSVRDVTGSLALALSDARAKRSALLASGEATAAIDAEILELRRRLREGGQLRIGDSLGDDRYLLLRSIGRGGFATVWEALDRRRRERVALKVLHPQLSHDSVRRDRFFRGARVMAELNDDAIVRVLEPYGEDGGFCYFVMELVLGGTFERAVLEHGLPVERVLTVGVTIAEALARVHAKGVVHRDVKPSNILLDESGAPKLSDFDLVADPGNTTGGTQTGAMGTFLYAAPEVLSRPQDAGPAADVFALGMTLLFGLYGRPIPLSALRDPELLFREIACPDAVKDVLRKATAWTLEDRYPDAGLFAAALRQANQALPKKAAPSSEDAPPDSTSVIKKRPSPSAQTARIGDGPVSNAPAKEPRPAAAPVSRVAILGFGAALLVAITFYLATGPDSGSTLNGSGDTNDPTSLVTATIAEDAAPPQTSTETTSTTTSAPSTSGSLSPRVICGEGSIPVEGSETFDCVDRAPVKKEEYEACVRDKKCRSTVVCAGSGASAAPFAGCVDWPAAYTFCQSRGASLPTDRDLARSNKQVSPDAPLREWTSILGGTKDGKIEALVFNRRTEMTSIQETTSQDQWLGFRCVTRHFLP